jgi:hypothetical protein
LADTQTEKFGGSTRPCLRPRRRLRRRSPRSSPRFTRRTGRVDGRQGHDDQEAVERFLTEHLIEEKGRDRGTVQNYRGVHEKWFAPEIGHRRVADVDEATIDRIFGRRRAWTGRRFRRPDRREGAAPLGRLMGASRRGRTRTVRSNARLGATDRLANRSAVRTRG